MKTGEIWIAQLNPTVGREIQKAGSCVIISPDDMNDHLADLIRAGLVKP